ncbi:hypothetical protein [Phenylobacterium sp. SCN 70-31]|uniref:hypothetical protein n=1 Tax=Phenylobacterium sp. SCN 70-31 TaxID=1660129 RepID=UPI00086A6A81|nr:hypothetical protein [Phenylobacterium sp. SCN 70-31]ODT88108.1 MAG: hypothetical protein ABS78_09455 [Phenylobacterium sp. SCN 70-31]
MSRLDSFSNSFASGEISEDAWERFDLEPVATGCEEALNFVGLTTGAIASRGGFWRRGAPKIEGDRQRLFPWALADGEGLVLEMGHLYARVWTAGGARIMDPSNPAIPYEFAHGYSSADLPGLRLKQIGDLGFITSRDGLLPVTLRRTADDAWSTAVQAMKNGPWLGENTDETRTLTFTDLGGNDVQVDCTGATWSLFKAGHVGSQLLIRPPGGYPGMKTWAPNTAVTGGENVISVGRVYQAAGSGTTGNTPPNHEQGTVSDGVVGWTFVHDGATAFLIHTYASPTQVIASPLGTPPFDLTGGPVATSNWREQAFSLVHGRPTALVAVREERLALSGSPERPDAIDFTRTAGWTPDFADFKPGLGTGLVVDDDACRTTLGDRRARIVWLIDALVLVAGTTEAEWIVSGATIEDPITPSSVKPRRISEYGSADVMPVLVQGPPPTILHIAKGGTTLRELPLGGGANSELDGRDLSILSQHVFGVGVTDMAWSRPDNNLWLLLADGRLACLTYHREHGVIGVRRQDMGGWFAESLCTAPGADGRDRLHVAALRVKAGTVQRAHFVLATRDEQMFLDCADSYSGAPATTIGNLSHFEGEQVFVLGDGADLGLKTVTSGQVTLDAAVSHAVVGLPLHRRFKSGMFDPRREGLSLAKRVRPVAAWVSLSGVEAVVRSENQDEPDDRPVPADTILQRRPGDATPVVRRKRKKVTLGGGADADVRLIVETLKPYDLKLYAIRPVYEEGRS